MNVHFIFDDGNADGTKGGAELTMEEFAAACPPEVAITDLSEAETVVVGNCVQFGPDLIPKLMDRKVWRYHHDLARHENPILRAWLDDNAEHIFTSPIQRERYGVTWDHGEREAHIIPPAVNLAAFRPNRQTRRHQKREGAVTVASWQNPGKGGQLLADVLLAEGITVDCYGPGDFPPVGPHVNHCGPVDHKDLPFVLSQYERFVYLPRDVEPFGRCVAEAWAAGLEIVTNDNVGAKWWIENEPGKLDTAADDFWGLICG